MLAVVDLGSNSFNLVIARVVEQDLLIVDRMKEPIRLAAGLDENRNLDPETQKGAIESLRRMGQRLGELPRAAVRAVGTSALRQAKNRRGFLSRAQKALGHPIEIVSGREEARLIYQGVAHSVAEGEARRLVVDIGGGSTECILGEGFEPVLADSLHMGCVNFSQEFFPEGDLRRECFRRAEIAARREVQSIERAFKALGWESCTGSAGTIGAIGEILRLNGWSRKGISRSGLKKLKKVLVEAKSVEAVAIPGLRPDRAPVLPGGLAILRGVFDGLGVRRMTPSPGAMREGVLYDLLGRIRHEDRRDLTIRRLLDRYHVDVDQAARVERTALSCLRQVAEAWDLSDPLWRQRLSWAARLHEAGMAVSYTGYQKHGAYLVANSDLPGFSTDDQLFLSALVRGHRRKIDRAYFEDLPVSRREAALRLCLLLRLAVLLNRSRSPRRPPSYLLRARGDRLEIAFPKNWLARHPLTRADLVEEAAYVESAGHHLVVR
jgi:exopolyphosphatase/guanosine-5'-triphosphate,3'-diphosphate pyrophosphatase